MLGSLFSLPHSGTFPIVPITDKCQPLGHSTTAFTERCLVLPKIVQLSYVLFFNQKKMNKSCRSDSDIYIYIQGQIHEYKEKINYIWMNVFKISYVFPLHCTLSLISFVSLHLLILTV